ncbi:MAG: hypothetical protein PHI98_05205 [Eubacteriales bacterium]|nr:hypothetical protein [Eubacteriales bacterium]
MLDSLISLKPKERTQTLLSWALMIFSPFLLLGALSLLMGKNAFSAYPVWSNELGCWQSVSNWNAVGLSGGYSGFFEVTPNVGSQGVYGLAPILLYGWFVKLFGLTPSSLLLCNATWISLGALVFCALNKPKPVVSLVITAFFLTYTPVILYAFTSMTELFDYAMVLLYIAFLLKYHRTHCPWMLLLCLLTVCFASFYRITFFLLFFPAAWLYGGSRMSKKTVFSALGLLALAFGCYCLSTAFTAPYQQGFLYNLLHAGSFDLATAMTLSHTKSNFIDYITYYRIDAVQQAFRAVYLFTAVLCLISAFVRFGKKEGKLTLYARYHPEMMGCFLWLTAELCIIMVLYETNDWSDFRILAPVLWLTPVYLCCRGHRGVPLTILAASLCMLIPLYQTAPVGSFADTERFTPPAIEERYETVSRFISYDPEADNPFDNSVRTDLSGWQLTSALEPGLGLESGWLTEDNIGKSRWLLTDTLKLPLSGYEQVYRDHEIALYRRSDSIKEP